MYHVCDFLEPCDSSEEGKRFLLSCTAFKSDLEKLVNKEAQPKVMWQKKVLAGCECY